MFRRRTVAGTLGLAVLAVALVVMSPLAAAAGSGYNLSYTRAPGSTSNANIDLTSVSSTDSGGATISVTFQVSGHLVLNSGDYVYWVWFGGSTSSNATGYASFSNNTTAGQWFSSSGGGYGYGSVVYSIGGGGSSLTFAMNKTSVGPDTSFGVNVESIYSTSAGAGGISWLGTNYQGALNCGPTGCTGPVVSAAMSAFWLYVIIGVVLLVVIVVVVVVVVVVVGRRRRAPPMGGVMPPAMAPPTGGYPAASPPPPPPPPSPPAPGAP